MIKWSEERGGSVSFENDDIRRSLEMLDDILAEYEHDSDNSACKSSENHRSYERYNSRSRPPPPPPEEAARVIVSYFPRCQNGIGGESSRGPAEEHEPLNADSCNNNAAYIDYELARLTDEYNMYEEKQKMANKPRSGLRNLSSPPLPSSPPLRGSSPRQTSNNRNSPAPPPPPKFLETRFPEFPEFQLRITGHGRYQTSDDDLEEASSSQSPDDSAGTSIVDEDSESRSGSEECSSVIEMPLKSGASSGSRPSSAVSPTGQQERPEDYVAVHPKKYFEDYPASVDSLATQVYSPPDDRANPRHSKIPNPNKRRNNQQELMDDRVMLIADRDADEEEDDEEDDDEQEEDEDEEDDMAVMDMTLPPPPAFETREMDDDQESDGDSPNLMDDTEYFYDITRSADDLSNDDEDGDEHKMEDEEDEGTITETSPRERFSMVHQMYREGSLDGLDETPPRFKPPPPPSSSHSQDEDFPTPSASEDEDEEEEDEECDEAHVRWRVALPNKGRGLVFGSTILLMNRQVKTYPRPSSVASSVASSITTVSSTRSGSRGARGISPKSTGMKTDDLMMLMDDQEFHLPSFSDVGSRSSLSSSSTLTHQRPLSAELLGVDRLPDVRSLVDSFNQKEVRAASRSPPQSLDRKPSKEFVNTLRKELPLFKNIKPVKPPTKPKTSEKPVKASMSTGTFASKSAKTPTEETHTSILKASITQPLQATKTKIMGMCKSSTLSHFPKVVKSHLTSSRPSGAMTLPKRESSRAAKAMALAMSLPSKAKNTIKIVTRPHTPSMEPTLLQTTAMPSRVSSDDLPRLLSYRVVNNDSLPPAEITTATTTSRIPKGATLPRISHENRRPQLSTEFGGPFSPPVNKDGTRRIPPPPPPLTKGPPPKIFVEVQPTRSESSCTSSCSCLCTKHQSPCQSPVPPPMPGAQNQITDGNVPERQEHQMVPYHNTTAIASTSRNEDDIPTCQQESGKGKSGGQPKKGKKNNPQIKKSAQNADKSGSEHRNNALIMEIQAAIQHRKSSDPDTKAASDAVPGTSIPGNRKVQSKTLPNLSAENSDKSPDKKGFFKGFLRRGNSGN